MIEIRKKEIFLYDKMIYGQMIKTDQGIQAFIGGGDLAHIGASTIIDPEGHRQSILFAGHREDVITDKWAEILFEKYKMAVVVSAGIHYDGISKEEILEVLKVSDEILWELAGKIEMSFEN